MLKVIYGENRVLAEKEVKRLLGENYEVFDGESLSVQDLPSIFQGVSLFDCGERRILLKNLADNAGLLEKIIDYTGTSNRVVIWEGKIDKRSSGYKALKEAGIELTEFVKPAVDTRVVFGILDLAMRDGEKAVREIEKIEKDQDPYMFFGLLVSQMLKKVESGRAGQRERRILKAMAKVDMEMKKSPLDPWAQVKALLVRVKEI